MNDLKLINVKLNKKYKIKKINLSNADILKLLNNLGIAINESIILLKSNYGKNSFLVNVSGINFAIDKKVCEGIIVYE